METLMKKRFFLNILAVMVFMISSCDKEDGPGADQTVEAMINSFRIVSPIEASGTVNNDNNTIVLNVPADEDVTTAEVAVELPQGATVVPSSGSEVDFTNPVEFTVTGSDASGNPVTRV